MTNVSVQELQQMKWILSCQYSPRKNHNLVSASSHQTAPLNPEIVESLKIVLWQAEMEWRIYQDRQAQAVTNGDKKRIVGIK